MWITFPLRGLLSRDGWKRNPLCRSRRPRVNATSWPTYADAACKFEDGIALELMRIVLEASLEQTIEKEFFRTEKSEGYGSVFSRSSPVGRCRTETSPYSVFTILLQK